MLKLVVSYDAHPQVVGHNDALWSTVRAGFRSIQNQGLMLIIDVVGIEDPEKALPKQGFRATIAGFDFVNVLIAHNERS